MNSLVRMILIALCLCIPLNASAWDPIRDITRNVRHLAMPQVIARAAQQERAAKELARARVAEDAAAIAAAQEKYARDKAEADRFERELQAEIEMKAITQLQSELTRHAFIEMSVDEFTLSKITRTLAKKNLNVEPRPFLNYIFVHIEPYALTPLGAGSTAELRIALYWSRTSNRIEIYYDAAERRLRSPDARPTRNVKALTAATDLIKDLSTAITGDIP